MPNTSPPRLIVAVVCALLSAFFVFYTVRLVVITHGLTRLRTGGGGAYVGAVVFPLLALGFAWLARRSLRARPPR